MALDVAVIIVSYKSARLTIDALQSVSAERRSADLHIRAVVVDNASGDAAQIAEAVATNGWEDWVDVVRAPRNGGFSYGNNLGVQQACQSHRPDYVYLLNPDAVVRPRAIVTLVQFLQTHAEVGIAGSSFEDPDGTEWPMAFRFPGLLSELLAGLQLGLATRLLKRWEATRTMTKVAQPTDWICGASMLIRTSVFEMLGGFDENYFLYYEETDLCLRARQAGIATWYVPESRVMHIRGQSTRVTNVGDLPKRLPAYWFDSRRRYFYVAFGLKRALAIDAIAVMAHALGTLKRFLQRRKDGVPGFIRDLLMHSIWWPRNRNIPPLLCTAAFSPGGRP